MDDKDFLKKLLTGDKVIVCIDRGFYSQNIIATVDKITPKGYIRVGDMLFDPDTGVARGGVDYLLEATPEAMQEIKKRYYVNMTIKKMHTINKLTYKQALGIMAILDSEE